MRGPGESATPASDIISVEACLVGYLWSPELPSRAGTTAYDRASGAFCGPRCSLMSGDNKFVCGSCTKVDSPSFAAFSRQAASSALPLTERRVLTPAILLAQVELRST